MESFVLDRRQAIILSILVLFLGKYFLKKISFLRDFKPWNNLAITHI